MTTKKPGQGTTTSTTTKATAPAKKAATPKRLPAGGPKGGPTPPPAPSFRVAETNGYHQCRICLLTFPVTSFPTISGPDVRSSRCRRCRDAVSPTQQVKRAAAQAVHEAEALLKTVAVSQAKGRKS